MHQKITLSFIVLLSSIVRLYAQFNSTPVSTTVESMKTMWEGSVVVLEGYLVKQLEKQIYIFRDSTGRIKVKITYQNFESLSVNPKIKVKLLGKIDVLWPSKSRLVNVEYVEIMALPKDINVKMKNNDCNCDN